MTILNLTKLDLKAYLSLN